jgi:hypothetical protein
MSKGTKKGSGNPGKLKGTVEIDPSLVRFTHARIRPFFTGCGMRIEDTIQEIVDGTTLITDLPLITVIENDGDYFSLNNRRLYTIKRIQAMGLLKDNKLNVYLKPALEREKKRYTVDRCSLQAKIMPERENHGDESASEEEQDQQAQPHPDTQKDLHETGSSIDAKAPTDPVPVKSAALKETKAAKSKSANEELQAPPKSSIAVPAEVSRELKELAKLVSKGKRKAVLSQLDEWEIAGILSDAQRDFVCLSIGLK